MAETNDTFSVLVARYSAVWELTNHTGATRASLMASFKPPHWRGVYVIYRLEQIEPLYIGSAGKLERGPNGVKNVGQTVRQRLFYANQPYYFEREVHVWRYRPFDSHVPPAGYHANIPICDIRIESFHVPDAHAPSALEHLLLQSCVNEFGNLPQANQKF